MAAIVKTFNGLALASLKTFGGLAAASLKTINGADATTTSNIVIQNGWLGTTSGAAAAITVTGTTGRVMVVGMTSNGVSHTTHAVTDNVDGATGWTKVTGVDSGTTNASSIWYKTTTSSLSTVTCTATGGAFVVGVCQEVSGLSASPFTGGESGTTSNVTPNITNPQTATVTNATANSLFFAVFGSNGSGSGLTINSTGTVGTWNYFNANCKNLNASFEIISMPNILVSTGTAEAHGWTIASTGNLTTVIAAFH